MPNVFISNKGNHDYSDSERYGSPIFVSSGLLAKFSVDQHLRLWKEALKFSSNKDYILLTSLTIFNCIGCAIFAVKHGVLNLLLFRNGKYLARTLILKDE